VQNQWVRTGRDQIDSKVIDHIQRAEIGENTLKVGADFQAVKGPFEIGSGHLVTTMKLDTLA